MRCGFEELDDGGLWVARKRQLDDPNGFAPFRDRNEYVPTRARRADVELLAEQDLLLETAGQGDRLRPLVPAVSQLFELRHV